MKSQIKNKKLSLNRVTVTKLDQEKMDSLKGGVYFTEWCTRDFWECNQSKFNLCFPGPTDDFLAD